MEKRPQPASRKGTLDRPADRPFTHRNRPVHIPDGYLVIGQIVGAHGIRGEAKVESHSDVPDRFAEQAEVYLGRDLKKVTIRSVRPHKNLLLIGFAGYSQRTDVLNVRGEWLYLPETAAAELEPDTYWVHDITGLAVVTGDGRRLGVIGDVLFTGANEVYVVETEPEVNQGKPLLIPAIDQVVDHVDIEAGTLTVTLLPGLLDE